MKNLIEILRNDDCYDDEDNSGRYYESREEAQEALVNEILRANKIEI